MTDFPNADKTGRLHRNSNRAAKYAILPFFKQTGYQTELIKACKMPD